MPVNPTAAVCAATILTILIGLAASCNKVPDSSAANSGGKQQPAATPAAESSAASTPPAAAAIDGKDIFAKANCTMCHGSSLEGGKLAPALSGLKSNWQAGMLREYLLDPAGYSAGDQRLSANLKNYTMKMPAWNTAGFSDEELSALVDWLLEQ